MRILLGVIVGAILGGFAGYMLGIEVACGLLDTGNLCGLIGVFITGPLGTIAGGVIGGLLSRKPTPTTT